MEYKEKIKIVITIASLAALSVLITSHYKRRRRSRKSNKCPPSSCYLHSCRLDKPQVNFKRVLADNSFPHFKHLTHNENQNASCLHPYRREIRDLVENPRVPELLSVVENGIRLKKMSDSFVWVETESQLKELACVLSKEKVFAVDTEQHSLRSFLGFTALIQISTYEDDYLVDAIALHDVMSILGPVFSDANICKVFHGADNDVLWLQRDFHIYVVNLFDTAKACEVLSKPQKSLAYLLETYFGVVTNKLLQREDWRQRPLSAEMLQYAQTDAHYLLYIAGCLIAELKQHDDDSFSAPNGEIPSLVEAVRRSNMTCLQLYAKEFEASPGESAASSILSRHLSGGGVSISCEIQNIVRRLCTWRELMARVHDESLRFVLSDQAIVSLAEKLPVSPAEISEIVGRADLSTDPQNFSYSVFSPSPVVSSHLDDLYSLFDDKEDNLENIFLVLLRKCLGPNGSCSLSKFNYVLLVNSELRLTNQTVSKSNGVQNLKHVARKASRELFVQKFSCKSPVYHNCRIYANDGRLLCYCDRRKLEWYLHRGLAKLLDDDPPAIMLLFEPKGRPEDEDNDFYIQSKKNICVGCGEGSHYLRYRIIPSCYRMHFPEHLKSHRSHDIVLLCVDCHEAAHAAAEKYKRQIAAELGVPLFVGRVVHSNEAPVIAGPSSNVEEAGVSPLQLRSAAMALLRHGPRMPPKRREELVQVVMQYYGGREITQEDLEKAMEVGMSPHERRRHQKKRGLSSKHSNKTIPLNKEEVNHVSTVSNYIAVRSSENDDLNGSWTGQEMTDKEEQGAMGAGTGDASLCSKPQADEMLSNSDCKSDGNDVSDAENVSIENGEKVQRNGTVDSSSSGLDSIDVGKSNSKISLLGHGPHGKQVVDLLMKEYGEDGIRQFCQRWRKVFVEAINPRFLPAGWDVMHSGRRDFGEYSVYNPTKKAATDQD